MSATAPPLSVVGGAGGFAARYDDMAATAGLLDDTAMELALLAARTHELLADVDVLAAAVVDPAGAVRFTRALLDALDGPGGLVQIAAALGMRAAMLRACVMRYRTADEASAQLLDGRRWAAGFAAGSAAPLVVALSPVGAVTAAAAAVGTARAGGLSRADLERSVLEHPALVDEAVGMAPGALTALTGGRAGAVSVRRGAALLAALLPSGAALATPVASSSSPPPRSFADLLGSVAELDPPRGPSENPGLAAVRRVETSDPGGASSVAWIVSLPGTRDWDPRPVQDPGAVHDLATNLRGVAGDMTSYEAGVVDALRDSGVRPGEPILLVGHSQGGLVAAGAAGRLVERGYAVTHVVTAGSPIGRVEVPSTVDVLSLENRYDPVPHLDAAENPDRSHRTTVVFSGSDADIGAAHGLTTSYAAGATALDGSEHPSISRFRAGLAPFLGGTTARSDVYVLTRAAR